MGSETGGVLTFLEHVGDSSGGLIPHQVEFQASSLLFSGSRRHAVELGLRVDVCLHTIRHGEEGTEQADEVHQSIFVAYSSLVASKRVFS